LKLLIVRHGDPDYEIDSLTEKGWREAEYLAERLAAGTGLRVNVSEDPITSVVLGLAKIIKDDNYKSVAYAIEGMSK
jgi:rod shape-determining protein MreB